jgi:phage FluMu protein Com
MPPSSPAATRAPTDAAADCRCLCGSLLARWVDGAVELKCRRCKRTLRVSLAAQEETPPASGPTLRAAGAR